MVSKITVVAIFKDLQQLNNYSCCNGVEFDNLVNISFIDNQVKQRVTEKKIKYYHLMTIPTDRRKLLLGKIIYIGYMILFSNVIVFAGATLGGFLLTTHVPVGGALIAVLFLTVSELWEIPVALFLSERFGMIVNLFVCLFITVSGVVISQTRIWYVLVSAIPMRMMCPLLHVLPNGLAAEAGNPLLDTGVIVPGMCISIIWFVFVTVLFLKWFERKEVK